MIGEYIRKLRTDKGHTACDLAEVLGITHQQATNYERNVSQLDVLDFFEVCKWLKVTPNKFYSYYFATLEEKEELLRK